MSRENGWAAQDERGVLFVGPHVSVPDWFMDAVTCGTCHRTWDDGVITSVTPAPAGRCPFEYEHKQSAAHSDLSGNIYP